MYVSDRARKKKTIANTLLENRKMGFTRADQANMRIRIAI